MRRVLSLSLLLGLAACANNAQMAPPQDDQQAKQFEPPASSKGALYIYRHEWMGFMKPVDVQVAGGASATLPVNTYLRLEGPPGPVEVDCKVGDKQGAAQIDIADGRTRYVEVSMTSGLWAPGCQVAEVAPEVGRAAVRASRRVEPQ
ncbi:MAG TPA: hypothetical protein VFB13_12215 [Reyranella sp.]|nr:hypothetical protein [Reyranella sp.]